MPDIFVGSVSVGVVPDARDWNNSLRRQLIPSANAIGTQYGQTMGTKISASMGNAGAKSGDAFSENFRKRIDAAIKALPDAKINGDSSAVEKKVADLRASLIELSHQDIIDGTQATKDLAVIEAE